MGLYCPVVQILRHVQLPLRPPWTTTQQVFLFFTISWSLAGTHVHCFFYPLLAGLIPFVYSFSQMLYFNILLKSGVGCLCLLSSVDDAESVHRGHRGKNLIILYTFQRLKTQPNLRTALGMLFTDFRT